MKTPSALLKATGGGCRNSSTQFSAKVGPSCPSSVSILLHWDDRSKSKVLNDSLRWECHKVSEHEPTNTTKPAPSSKRLATVAYPIRRLRVAWHDMKLPRKPDDVRAYSKLPAGDESCAVRNHRSDFTVGSLKSDPIDRRNFPGMESTTTPDSDPSPLHRARKHRYAHLSPVSR